MLETNTTDTIHKQVYEALREVYDPELGVDIIDLGLVYEVDVTSEGHVTITMTLTTPGCPMHESLAEGVSVVLANIPGITSGKIQLVWTPPWSPSMMTTEGRRLLGFQA